MTWTTVLLVLVMIYGFVMIVMESGKADLIRRFYASKKIPDGRFGNAPPDVLTEIFKWLPSKDAVVCSMVCKNWSDIVNSHHFWICHCKFHDYLADSSSIQHLIKIPTSALKVLITKKAFNRNLLDDDYSSSKPKIDSRWSDYNSKQAKASSFQVESPPMFLSQNRRLDLDECAQTFSSCLVTSYLEAKRHIYIDLAKYGLTTDILNEFKPTIVVTEYYTNRSDCGCIYAFRSLLMESRNGSLIPNSESRLRCDYTEINQWEEQYWRKAEHVWKDYDDGKNTVMLIVSGKDRQFWAGQYGVKIAGTSVEVKLEFNQS